MKQLTILCSSDLSGTVQRALTHAGLEGYLQIPGATGFKPPAAAARGDTPRYPAEMYVAAAGDEEAARLIAELESYAGQCDVEPCLRILVSSLLAAY